ncbi:MAG: hypothetical protein WAW96_16855 [Alphaproteobacteria bacterium]
MNTEANEPDRAPFGGANLIFGLLGLVATVATLGSLSDGTVSWTLVFRRAVDGYRAVIDPPVHFVFGWLFALTGISYRRELSDMVVLNTLLVSAYFQYRIRGLAYQVSEGRAPPHITPKAWRRAQPVVAITVWAAALALGGLVGFIIYFSVALITQATKVAYSSPRYITLAVGGATYLIQAYHLLVEDRATPWSKRRRKLMFYFSPIALFGALLIANATLRLWFGVH